jgi:hypothetical protein
VILKPREILTFFAPPEMYQQQQQYHEQSMVALLQFFPRHQHAEQFVTAVPIYIWLNL